MTVSGFAVANKVYDSTTSATITDNGTLSGVLSGDSVTLGTGSASTAFASSNVGTGIAVTAFGYTISGTDAGNYTLIQPSTTANITAAGLTISAGNVSITYGDGNDFNGYTVSGLLGYDSVSSVTLSSNAATSGSGNWNTGNWTITPSGASGSGLSNYSISYVDGTLAISPLSLTISGFAVANKTYDGTTAATITDNGMLVGVISGDDVGLATSGATRVLPVPISARESWYRQAVMHSRAATAATTR